jgi:hypothetical protein
MCEMGGGGEKEERDAMPINRVGLGVMICVCLFLLCDVTPSLLFMEFFIFLPSFII